jgi:type I restriction enzyme S subunit
VRLIQLADIGDGTFRNRSRRFLTSKRANEMGCTFLEVGDILVARMPEPLGRACIFPGVGQPAVTAVDICIARPNPVRASPTWLMRAINSPQFRDAMQAHIRGTTRQRISRRNLGTLTLPVPGIKEQQALVQHLDLLDLPRTSAKEHLSVARQALERFRQSVLGAACAGRLTADWRTSLGRIDGDVPTNWRDVTLKEIGQWSTGGTPSRKVPHYFGGSFPWVKSGDLRDGLVRSTEESLTQAGLDNSSAKLLPAGTVSVALYGATIGRVGILDIQAATNQACANCVPDESQIDRWFLLYFLLSERQALIAAGQGGAQPNLTNQIVKDWPARLPPLDEQREIVSRVEDLLARSESIGLKIVYVARRLDRASQAVSSQAFTAHSARVAANE